MVDVCTKLMEGGLLVICDECHKGTGLSLAEISTKTYTNTWHGSKCPAEGTLELTWVCCSMQKYEIRVVVSFAIRSA